SSRRRHTRFSRDWSSDVCSSDLRHSWPGNIRELRNVVLGALALGCSPLAAASGSPPLEVDGFSHRPYKQARREVLDDFERRYLRSEERRVGKERRSRGGGGRSTE